jgi:hypothetical protein
VVVKLVSLNSVHVWFKPVEWFVIGCISGSYVTVVVNFVSLNSVHVWFKPVE